MNVDLEKLKAEHAEYLQLMQLKDFMAAVNDLLDKKDAELEALRKIASCFQKGDFDRLSWMTCDCDLDKLDYTEEFHQEMLRMVHRLQAAAKLAEDGA